MICHLATATVCIRSKPISQLSPVNSHCTLDTSTTPACLQAEIDQEAAMLAQAELKMLAAREAEVRRGGRNVTEHTHTPCAWATVEPIERHVELKVHTALLLQAQQEGVECAGIR